MTFYVFLKGHFKKKRKKSCFLKTEKKHKIRILEHCFQMHWDQLRDHADHRPIHVSVGADLNLFHIKRVWPSHKFSDIMYNNVMSSNFRFRNIRVTERPGQRLSRCTKLTLNVATPDSSQAATSRTTPEDVRHYLDFKTPIVGPLFDPEHV